MMNPSSQGGQANLQGKTLESTIKIIMSNKGFSVLSYSEWKKDQQKHGNEVLVSQVPYTTIYNKQGKMDFLLISEKFNKRIAVECKWQQSGGSVDEKYPYLYLNCVEAIQEDEIIIVLDGGGYHPGALSWLKGACQELRYSTDQKSIRVFNLTEFITWANNTFK
jgi:hypothetical protein